MRLIHYRIATIAVTALATAACSSLPFGRSQQQAYAPAPLAAAPTGSITGTNLPPPPGAMQPGMPMQPGVAESANLPATAPGGLASLDPAMQPGAMAPGSVPPGAVAPGMDSNAPPPAPGTSAAAIGRTDLLGGWTITAVGDSCQLFMTLTTWAGGYRASTRGCATPTLQKVSAWNMEGGQVQLLNDAGSTVARLYATSKTQFNGQTDAGGPVTVSR